MSGADQTMQIGLEVKSLLRDVTRDVYTQNKVLLLMGLRAGSVLVVSL